MTVTDFEFICQILRDRSGLVLTNDKAYLLESRLLPVARKWKMTGFDDLVKALRARSEEAMVRDVVEAMTTNESFFFRDTKPFDQFKQLILPALLKNRAASKTIRIWSAACSSGQEAYSLAMILSEMAPQLAGWKIDIVGTDLSTEILTRAKDGLYSQFEVQRGLPITLLVKYFQQVGDRWQISQKIRSAVQYREFNLLNDPGSLGRFDVVFCRNVLIYFDQPTKAKVLNGIAKQMPEDGYLILGGAETVLGLTDRFQLVTGQRGVYCVVGADAAKPAAGFVTPPRPLAGTATTGTGTFGTGTFGTGAAGLSGLGTTPPRPAAPLGTTPATAKPVVPTPGVGTPGITTPGMTTPGMTTPGTTTPGAAKPATTFSSFNIRKP